MSDPVNSYVTSNSTLLWGEEEKDVVRIPGRFDFERAGKKNWFEGKYTFLPPPGFVDLLGPTTQKHMGMVRGVPVKFSREINIIGAYQIGYLEYMIHRAPSKIPETERFIRIGTCPDGYGNSCLLFQCMEAEEKSVWACLKPERE